MNRAKYFLLSCMIIFLGISEQAYSDDIVRIAVARFVSSTSEATDQQAAAITDIFTDTLMHTKSIAVIERSRLEEVLREQRLGLAALTDPATAAKAGRLLGCQYVILGSVTHLKENISQTRYKKSTTTKVEAEASLYARVIDTTTSEVTYSESYTGKASDKFKSYHSDDYSRSEGLSSMKQQAITSAARILSSKIRESIADESARVIAVDGGTISLNRGSALGVHKRDLYLVYTDGKEIRDLDGTILGSEVLNIAVIEIDDVQEKYSRAGVIKRRTLFKCIDTGSPAFIRVGDKTRYITDEEADALVKRKAFITSRPKPEGLDSLTEDVNAKNSSGQKFEKVSTNPERVIANYDLPEGEKNSRISLHKKLVKAARNRNTYSRYVELANSYDGDYLAAYQAGMTALALGMKSDAFDWFNKALMINPDYKPAQEGRAKLR